MQDAVNRAISEIHAKRAKELEDKKVATKCGEFFDYRLASIKGTVSERTYNARETYTRLYLKPALKPFDLNDVRPIQFRMIYNQMVAQGKEALTIRGVHRPAGMIFEAAFDLELIRKNPRSDVKMPKVSAKVKTKAMTAAEAKLFLAECKTSKHGIVFEFALETGARLSALKYIIGNKLEIHRLNQKKFLGDLEERIRRREIPSRESLLQPRRETVDKFKELNLNFPSASDTLLEDVNSRKR